LILTNIDEYDNIRSFKYIGVGSYYNLLQPLIQSNPVIKIGKPYSIAYHHINNINPINPSSTLMVGDRLNTDIQFAINNHFQSMLVFSGVTQSDEY